MLRLQLQLSAAGDMISADESEIWPTIAPMMKVLMQVLAKAPSADASAHKSAYKACLSLCQFPAKTPTRVLTKVLMEALTKVYTKQGLGRISSGLLYPREPTPPHNLSTLASTSHPNRPVGDYQPNFCGAFRLGLRRPGWQSGYP